MRRRSPRISPAPRTKQGALAQLVERFNGIEEVNGSTPLCSSLRGMALQNKTVPQQPGRVLPGKYLIPGVLSGGV